MPTPTIDELTLAERARALGGARLRGQRRLLPAGGVRVRFAGPEAGRGIVGWSLRDLASAELDGLPTSASRRPASPPALAAAERRDRDRPHRRGLTRSRPQRAALRGRRPRSAPRARAADPRRRSAPGVLSPRRGDPRARPESRRRSFGAPGGRDRPARLWGLALLVDDLDRTVELFAPHVPPARAAVQPGRRITTVARTAGLGMALALMSRDERRDDMTAASA